jgi:serine/threonine protein kinase
MIRSTPAGLLNPGDLIGNYRVEGAVGTGGFGEVFLARHRVLGTLVVLKVPHTPGLRRALLREAVLQSHLGHPNVVQLLDVLEVAGCPVLVMEYVAGCTLSAALRDRKVPTEERSRIVRLVVRAVAHAHSLRVVHLDLKPANILLFRDDDGLSLKVCDFGLARVRTHAEPISGALWAGTPAYMAPEQFGGDVDQRADVYALGCLIYELFAGVRPFVGNWMQIGYDKQDGRYAPLSTLRPDLDRESRIVERCLRADPAERYADARELLRDWCPTGRTTPRGLSFLPARAPLSRTPVPVPRSSAPPA